MNYTERKCKMDLVCRSCNDATESFACLGGSKGGWGAQDLGERGPEFSRVCHGKSFQHPVRGTGNPLL